MHAERIPRRSARSLLRRALVVLLLLVVLPAFLLGLDSAWTVTTSPAHRTTITEVSPGDRSAPTYRSDSAAIFVNGLGLDVSERQARALSPSVGRFGRVYSLAYASVFDADRAADAVAEAIRDPEHPKKPSYLTVLTSSMGDVRGLEIIASLQQRHEEVRVVGFVVNTGPGPGKRLRVRGGETIQRILDQSCSPFVPGSVTLGLVELANQTLQGNVDDLDGAAAAFNAGRQYRGHVLVNQLCSLTRPAAITDPPTIPYSVYLGVADPADDVVVYTEPAYDDWLDLLPGMEIRRVRGATHDNFHFRPDLFNPLLTHDILPKISSARRLAYPPRPATAHDSDDPLRRRERTFSGPARPV